MNKKILYLTTFGILFFVIGLLIGRYLLAPQSPRQQFYRCTDCDNRGSEYSCKECRRINFDFERLHQPKHPESLRPVSEKKPGCQKRPIEMRAPENAPQEPITNLVSEPILPPMQQAIAPQGTN